MKTKNNIWIIIMGFILPLTIQAQNGINNSTNVAPLSLYTNAQPLAMTEPSRTVESLSQNETVINYTFNGFRAVDVMHANQKFQYLHIQNFSKMGEIGKPALPAHNDIVILPGESYTIQILQSNYKEYSGYNVYPAKEAASDLAGTPEPEFVMDQTTYSTNAYFPSDIVEVIEVQKIRGLPFGIIQIRPIQFNPVTHRIRVYSNIKYKISYTSGAQEYDRFSKINSNHFLNNFKNVVLNSNLLPAKANLSAKSSNDAKDIIIIAPTAYQAAADSLAQWKRQLGFGVKLITQASWTTSQVKDSVHNLYQNWTPKPDYLIILGDQADVPAESILYGSSTYLTDLYYVCMDGTGDYFPDMARGRISVNSSSQAMSVVQKIINYERNPVADASFYSNVLASTYFQDGSSYGSYNDSYADRRFVHTTEEIRDYLVAKSYNVERVYCAYGNRNPLYYNNGYYSNGQSLPSDLLKSNGFNWDGDATDIINSINAGKFLVFHRDHGYDDGYGWEHPYFLNQEASALVSNGNHINQLSNGNKLPVLLSINCETGNFSRPECFAENFLRKDNGGAVGVVAPSYSTFSGYNDALAIGIIDALWSNPGLIAQFGAGGISNPTLNTHSDMPAMGDALNQGLLRMTQTWSSTTQYKMQHETFTFFGDPSMKLWTQAPTTISWNTVDTVVRFDSVIHIDVYNCSDAIVTLMFGDSVVASTQLVNGKADLNYSVSTDVQATLCIYKHNFRPIVKHFHIDNRVKQAPPISQARNIRFIADGGAKSTSMTVAWDKGDGDFSMVKISDDGNFTTPTNGVEYSANTVYSGSGEQVVFSGLGTSVTVSNLVSGQTYWFRVYEYNNEGIYTLYQTSTDVNNPNAPDAGGTLPVQLEEFSAAYNEAMIEVSWRTLVEINNDYFILQRSHDNKIFENIAKIKGHGNTNLVHDYSYSDNDISTGIYYYRLIQRDFDGSQTVSNSIAVEVNKDARNNMLIQQNQGNISIQLNGNDSYQQLSLIDMSGKTVYQQLIQDANASISIPKNITQKGVYLIAFQGQNNREVKKVIIH